MYLFMRAPQIKPAIAEKGPQQSPAPSASATSSPDFPPAPTPAIVTLAEERRRNEIASGYIHQWTITHPSGPDWHSPEGIAWINRQLKKKNEPFTVTANKVPLAAVNAGNTPAIIRGLVTANSPIGIIANGAGSTVTGNTQVNFPPPATATAPTAQPPAINIAPGGFATSGGYLDHPTIINPKPAPPEVVGLSQTYLAPVPPFVAPPTEAERMQKAIQYNQSLGFERANKEMTSAPGLTLAFGVSAPFVDPAFSVQCAHCVVTSTSVHAGDGSGSFRATNGLPSVLTPDVDVVITVRSTDQTPVTDVTVTPRPTPQ
jgi:hypothetical protein